jgi:hypothetical protein
MSRSASATGQNRAPRCLPSFALLPGQVLERTGRQATPSAAINAPWCCPRRRARFHGNAFALVGWAIRWGGVGRWCLSREACRVLNWSRVGTLWERCGRPVSTAARTGRVMARGKGPHGLAGRGVAFEASRLESLWLRCQVTACTPECSHLIAARGEPSRRCSLAEWVCVA